MDDGTVSVSVRGVDAPLVHEKNENDVITEDSKSVHVGHDNDKSKNIVDESVESRVSEYTPRKVSNRFQLVVHIELWHHHKEPEPVHGGSKRVQCPAIDGDYGFCIPRVHEAANNERDSKVAQVLHGDCIV